MDIPPKAIEDFKKIYFEEFGEKLSKEEAYDRAMEVLQIFSILLFDDEDE